MLKTNGRQQPRSSFAALRIFLVIVVLGLGTSFAIVKAKRDGQPTLVGHSAALPAEKLMDESLIASYRQLITPQSLAARLYFLASDLFEGRETTTRGQKLAAEYLASQYRQFGLSPSGTEHVSDPQSPASFYQTLAVHKRAPNVSRLEVAVDGRSVVSSQFSSDSHDDLSFFVTGSQANVTANVVFAGYGIADDQLHFNDYAALAAKNISLKDKWVMILEDEPLENATTSLLLTKDRKPSQWSTQFLNKRLALLDAGLPKGVLVVADSSPRTIVTFSDQSTQAATLLNRVGQLTISEASFPPTFAISSKLADRILLASHQTVAGLKKQIDTTLQPSVFEIDKSVTVSSTVEPFKSLTTENVLAFIEGSDPKLKNEVVVVSAHYDHLGRDTTLKGDQIFNGAADDGSGTVATLAIAEMFMKAKRDGHGPRRSILIANFSGEEKGTLGSAFYSSNPVIPWERTVADINMDGVAGIDPKHPTGSKNYIYLVGTKELSADLTAVTRAQNQAADVRLDLTDGPPFGSDHQNFASQLIPFLYFSTGYTEKYHRPEDEPGSIDYEHFARVVRLAFATTWQVVNQDPAPSRIARGSLKLVGYTCQPCRLGCDAHLFKAPGECPACGMQLVPKYEIQAANSVTGR